MKRLFDVVLSIIFLLLLLPLFLVFSVLIRYDGMGPIFFRQERIGKDFQRFKIFKFRTMLAIGESGGSQVTVAGDTRITKVGKFLRKYKIDELPQLLNIIKGDMSFVGPRPEVPRYVEIFKTDYEILLKVRPGMTDPASIEYSNEETLLSPSENWEDDYVRKILPDKIAMSKQYVLNQSFFLDLKIIVITIIKIFKDCLPKGL